MKNAEVHSCYFESPAGNLCVSENGKGICALFFCGKAEEPGNEFVEKTLLLEQAVGELQEYFAGKRESFQLPLSLHGTDFQMRVWKELMKIPYGETRSYKQIAEAVGNPRACRAVGMANNRNPVGIIVPCHRVIGKNGGLTGYAGGLEAKRKLLELEKDTAEGRRKERLL